MKVAGGKISADLLTERTSNLKSIIPLRPHIFAQAQVTMTRRIHDLYTFCIASIKPADTKNAQGQIHYSPY